MYIWQAFVQWNHYNVETSWWHMATVTLGGWHRAGTITWVQLHHLVSPTCVCLLTVNIQGRPDPVCETKGRSQGVCNLRRRTEPLHHSAHQRPPCYPQQPGVCMARHHHTTHNTQHTRHTIHSPHVISRLTAVSRLGTKLYYAFSKFVIVHYTFQIMKTS